MESLIDATLMAQLGQLYDKLTTDERIEFLILFFESHLEKLDSISNLLLSQCLPFDPEEEFGGWNIVECAS